MELHPLNSSHLIAPVITDANAVYQQHTPNRECTAYLMNAIKNNPTTTYVAMHDHNIIGMAIFEMLEHHYGNLILHCLSVNDESALGVAVAPLINERVVELISLRPIDNYQSAFQAFGLYEKERVRMTHHDIGQYASPPDMPNITYRPLTLADTILCGDISHNAHYSRQSIEQYDTYSSPSKRAAFSKSLRTEKKNDGIAAASLLMMNQGAPIGIIEMAETLDPNQCPMGWIMDIAIRHDMQGHGYGRQLIKKSLGEAYMAGYSSVGLSVTTSHTHAFNLYRQLGFEDEHYFIEITGREAPSVEPIIDPT
jgi:ribosomal protein S18 acetylase RimI-like enzyme